MIPSLKYDGCWLVSHILLTPLRLTRAPPKNTQIVLPLPQRVCYIVDFLLRHLQHAYIAVSTGISISHTLWVKSP
jgi:hypothetical protein